MNGHGDPMEVTGNTWSVPPSNWSASSFVGPIYSGFVRPNEPDQPMVIWDPNAWVFRGLTLTKGTNIPGLINSDIDHINPGGAMPSNIEVFAHSPIPLSVAYTNQGSWNGATYSDMTYYSDPVSQAGVFSSGDNIWVGKLQPCQDARSECSSTFVRAVTTNVFWLFGQGPAGKLQPSVPNWAEITPKGS